MIYLVRHAQSKANTGEVTPNKEMPDNRIPLTDLGVKQARELGTQLKEMGALENSLIFHSPFRRTAHTLAAALKEVDYYVPTINSVNEYSQEDPRLREVDVGTGKFHENIRERARVGWFYYRFPNGETPCEVYDRSCSFFNEAMVKCLSQGKDMVCISHGMTIRALLMRAMNLTVEDFNKMDNPSNCSVIRIGQAENLDENDISIFDPKTDLAAAGVVFRKEARGNDYSNMVEM